MAAIPQPVDDGSLLLAGARARHLPRKAPAATDRVGLGHQPRSLPPLGSGQHQRRHKPHPRPPTESRPPAKGHPPLNPSTTVPRNPAKQARPTRPEKPPPPEGEPRTETQRHRERAQRRAVHHGVRREWWENHILEITNHRPHEVAEPTTQGEDRPAASSSFSPPEQTEVPPLRVEEPPARWQRHAIHQSHPMETMGVVTEVIFIHATPGAAPYSLPLCLCTTSPEPKQKRAKRQTRIKKKL
ncbi:hypothetical protein BRADI_5g04617v3 [Brachypodium distachyon]|uniref:Uncharacterized protein n=1 Tax=Brachypodium distachyon TaxID=15368 RepID=A0A2K2CFG5_BRADI|nr:hypothetical protein BRADI_5g04617v3 [Brachypodium distachyon]